MVFQKELINSFIINAGRTAIESGDRSISYSQLLQISNAITQYLLNKKLHKQTIVGIQISDRANLIAAMIGVINAGCVFVLIDNTLPANRLKGMLEDVNLSQVLTSNADSFTAFETKYFIEDILDQKGGEHETEFVYPEFVYPEYHANDSLYIYFTSGSTGRPKGIVGKNCSLLQFLQWQITEFGIDHTCRVSQLISPYFDAFLRDIFVPLLAGGAICIPPAEEDFLSPEKLGSWIDKQAISLIHCVPSLFRVINSGSLLPEKFTHLKYIMLSGERTVPSELINWYNTFNNRIQLVNFYGATETTMIRSFYRIKPEDARLVKIPIGKPIADTSLLICKENFKPCGVLIAGDLFIVSDYVTLGYLNAPELTREKFNTYRKGAVETIAFKTGDKARRLSDGQVELIGREDRMIKLRGIRIEPEEIENILIQSLLVKQAVVVGHSKETGEELLMAFVIRAKEIKPGVDFNGALHTYMKENLPAYMIPSQVVAVNEYPLLSNGKIDYRALLQVQPNNKIVAPQNKIEDQLLAIWKEILGDQPISTDNNFYQLGGTSLALIRLMAKIYSSFNIRIKLNEIFNNLTIQRLAAFIGKSVKDNAWVIPKAAAMPAYPLSSAQERMHYHYQLDKVGTAFNLPMVWELQEGADVKRIEEVITLLIERHESFRTEFIFEKDGFKQVIKDTVDFTFQQIIDEGDNIHKAISRFVKPFDLGKAPLIRAGIITFTAKGKRLLVVDMHHIICDGMSQIILMSDFFKLYNKEQLKPLSRQYKDFAIWESNFKSTGEYIFHREFWLKSFEKIPQPLQFPVTPVGQREIADGGGMATFTIEHGILSNIMKPLQTKEITPFSVLLSIYYLFLAQLTGQEDIVIGVVTSGREQAELEGVAGMFAKTLPIRYKMNPYVSFNEFAADLHRYFVQANSRQIYDLVDIVREINNNKATPIQSLFQTLFVFQNFEYPTFGAADGEFTHYPFEITTAKYPIMMVVTENADAFHFEMNYAMQYFNSATIETLIAHYKALVYGISQNAEAKIVDCIGANRLLLQVDNDNITFNF